MKRKILLTLISILPLLTIAQEKLNKLQAPTSPASSILGLQPSAVLSPKSYQALETALYSNFMNNSGNTFIPNDFALEFTPYWTKNHGLSLQEYLYPNGFDQFVRNSSFSTASTQNFLLGDSTATNSIAFGYRTTFYIGNKTDRETVENFTSNLLTNMKISAKVTSEVLSLIINNKISNQEELMGMIRNTILQCLNESGKFDNQEAAVELTNIIIEESAFIPPLEIAQPQPFVDSLNAIIDKKLKAEATYNNFKEYIGKRYGLSIDIAYAGFLNFPTNSFESSYLPRQSFWITPTYNFRDKWSFLKVMAVIRYEWYNSGYYKEYFIDSKIFENNIDYGKPWTGVWCEYNGMPQEIKLYPSNDYQLTCPWQLTEKNSPTYPLCMGESKIPLIKGDYYTNIELDFQYLVKGRKFLINQAKFKINFKII